ncbi:unnamed protein product [Amoebophrya sp. A25]|nr:unnamed protein product [Amoebophrya sp. A25]|eukprot:GSA25T00002452001.1
MTASSNSAKPQKGKGKNSKSTSSKRDAQPPVAPPKPARFVVADDTGLCKLLNATAEESKEVEQTFGSQGKQRGVVFLEKVEVAGQDKNTAEAGEKELDSKKSSRRGIVLGRESGAVELWLYKHVATTSASTSTEDDTKSEHGADDEEDNGNDRKEEDAPPSDEEEEDDDDIVSVDENGEILVDPEDRKERNKALEVGKSGGTKKGKKEDVEDEDEEDCFSSDDEEDAKDEEKKSSSVSKTRSAPAPRFDDKPTWSANLDIILHPKDPTKNEKLIFGAVLEGEQQLLVLSQLGNVWILDCSSSPSSDVSRATTEAASPSKSKNKVVEERVKPTFTLPGTFIQPLDKKWSTSIKPRSCVKSACFKKQGEKHLLAYGGTDNDVRVFDVKSRKLEFKAKNLPNDRLDLQVPLRYTRLHWMPEAFNAETAIVAVTGDARVRIFDTAVQERALFDLPIVYKRERSSAYSGCANNKVESARPVQATCLTSKGRLVTGDTVGNIDVLDVTGCLSYLKRTTTEDKSPSTSPKTLLKAVPKIGTPAHCDFVREKKIVQYLGASSPYGSAIRGLVVLPETQQLVCVGLGRFANIARDAARNRRVQDKRIYLKQKLSAVVALDAVEEVVEEDARMRSSATCSSSLAKMEDIMMSEDLSDEEEEEEYMDDELSYGSYEQEFDDESSSEDVPQPKKRRRNK